MSVLNSPYTNKRILIVDLNGTSPSYTHYFGMALNKSGLHVTVLGHRNAEDINIFNEQLSYIGLDSTYKWFNYIMNLFSLVFLVKKYDVIHIQWLPMLKYMSLELYLIKVLRLLNGKIVYTAHNFFPHNEKKKSIKKRYLRLYRILDTIVVNSETTVTKFRRFHLPTNLIKVHHGVFYSEFAAERENISETIVMIGMMSRYKNIEIAIKAISHLKKEGYDFKLIIEGSGAKDYQYELKQLIDDLGLAKQVFFKSGYVAIERLIDAYKESFVTLLPYKDIEQSGVLFTALGLNRPVVAFNVGGLKEIINNGYNGKLVPFGDVKNFEEAIIWVHSNQMILKQNIRDDKACKGLWQRTARILINEYFK